MLTDSNKTNSFSYSCSKIFIFGKMAKLFFIFFFCETLKSGGESVSIEEKEVLKSGRIFLLKKKRDSRTFFYLLKNAGLLQLLRAVEGRVDPAFHPSSGVGKIGTRRKIYGLNLKSRPDPIGSARQTMIIMIIRRARDTKSLSLISVCFDQIAPINSLIGELIKELISSNKFIEFATLSIRRIPLLFCSSRGTR